MIIHCAGDIMPGGVLNKTERPYLTKDLQEYLKSVALFVGTLECAIGDDPHFDEEKMRRKQDIVYAENRDLQRIKLFGKQQIVSLANNHIFDLGAKGLENTIKQLDEHEILHCGAGRNIAQATQPVIINTEIGSIAFISVCDYRNETVGYVPFASSTKSGVSPLYPLRNVGEQIAKLKKQVDYIFVLSHWGIENVWEPTNNVVAASNYLIKAGADVIIGSHPHRVQCPYTINRKPVFPSLGNFFFPDRYLNTPRPTYYPPLGEDTSRYPVTDCYPYVDEPTLKIWKHLARIGMIAEIKIEAGKISSDYKLTYLSKDNILGFIDENEQSKVIDEFKRLHSWLNGSNNIYRIAYSSKLKLRKLRCYLRNHFLNHSNSNEPFNNIHKRGISVFDNKHIN